MAPSQVLENIRRQSCEGLALPFLGNWFLGDLSNLIGCLLTHQLPFQTYLATYFVFVDLSLLCQYIYYSPKGLSSTAGTRTRPRATSTLSQRSIDRTAPHYRTLSAVAANVAHAAALAAKHEENVHPRRSRRWKRELSVDVAPEGSRGRIESARDGYQEADDEEGETINPLTLSFHSELGDPETKRRVTWSAERRGASVGRTPLTRNTFAPSQQGDLDDTDRGRSAHRSVDLDAGTEVESPTVRRTSRASRRGASLVFLGAWTLLSVGTLASSRRGIPPTVVSDLGRVVSVGGIRIPFADVTVPHDDSSHPIPSSSSDPIEINLPLLQEPPQLPEPPNPPPPPHSDDPDLSSERILGRIFAWLCTILYLTSRLPQIWKNYVRKSVEGLSMYLFVFAFLGNCFYVLSIMTSPQVREPAPISTAFLKESLPYLLGSGGTLMFDITIVSQSFVYRPRPRHRSSLRSSRLAEEEAGLLSSEPLDSSTAP
ncbi:hypothetical protein ONZ45_g11335 [Pleurotus djamor]|nr:hypothetical protein ONZ45_g11335 [Pleurotus djamor]